MDFHLIGDYATSLAWFKRRRRL